MVVSYDLDERGLVKFVNEWKGNLPIISNLALNFTNHP